MRLVLLTRLATLIAVTLLALTPSALRADRTAPQTVADSVLHADSLARGSALSKAGLQHWNAGRYDSALANLAQARLIFSALGERQKLAQTFNNIGGVHFQLGQHEPALASYLASLTLRRELRDTRGIVLVLANIGGTYVEWRLYDRALPILQEAVATAEQLGEPFALGWATHALGMLYLERGDHIEARAAFERSIHHYAAGARARPADAFHGWALNAVGLGSVFVRSGQPALGAMLLRRVLASDDPRVLITLEARALYSLGEALLALGDRRAAVDAFTRSVASANSREQRVSALRALEQLADMEEASGNFRDALLHWRAFRALRDSVYNQGAMQRIATMEAQLRLDEQQRENARLQEERGAQSLLIARQRLQVAVVGASLIVAAVVLAALALKQREGKRRERLLAQSNTSLAAVNEELQQALLEVRALTGLIPICARCKRVRDDRGFWEAVETYIAARSEATFSHAICASCGPELYGADWTAEHPGTTTSTSAPAGEPTPAPAPASTTTPVGDAVSGRLALDQSV